jgi:hypothetical protein
MQTSLPGLSRDQALLNNLIAQRDQLANASANLGADLDMARASVEQLQQVIAAKDAELAAAHARVAELEAKSESRPAEVNS